MFDEKKYESELVCQLKNGDEKAFRILYEKYAPKLKAFSRRWCFSDNDGDDIIQETFQKIWEKRSALNEGLSFNSYVISIAKNLIYNKMRHCVYIKKYQDEFLHSTPVSETVTRNFDLERIINETVKQLPEKCRYIYKRSRIDGFSNVEIAEELHISKSTVENQINKALGKIKSALRFAGYSITILIFLFKF